MTEPGLYKLPPLPYADDALAPIISVNTLRFHYGKHHQGYVDRYNELTRGTPMAGRPLEDVIKEAAKTPEKATLFNMGAQIWNHTFYWNSLHPKGGGEPKGRLKDKIEASFGGLQKFREELALKATGLFGSGWAWVVEDRGKITVLQTKDADTPFVRGQKPLLTIDVWEHAYYLDYQNRRKEYVDAVLNKLVNWEFAAKNLG